MQTVQFNPAFDGWRICGQGNQLRILTDDTRADQALEAMGLHGRYHAGVQAMAYVATPQQVIRFLQAMTGEKPMISEKQRAARAANARRATEARMQHTEHD